MGKLPTALLGPQYKRSRTRIHLDLTYACNLKCLNCNRSVTQAPSTEHMTVAQVAAFVDESLASGKHWEHIGLLGGEPTIHPDFFEILDVLLGYKAQVPGVEIIIYSNGHGDHVRDILQRIPAGIDVCDTEKESPEQPFAPFNVAPIDVPAYDDADYSNGCSIPEYCGMALTPWGYYPCAVAGGIDRIFGEDNGRRTLPHDADDMTDLLENYCKRCGHFERRDVGTFSTETSSKTWDDAYEQPRPKLTRYHTDD